MFQPSILISLLSLFICLNLLFLVSLKLKDNSIIDIFWGSGFVIVSAITLFIPGEITVKKLIISLAVTAWGLRLSIYLFIRKKGKGEDYRYKAWRNTWQRFRLRSYFQVFILQGLIMFLVSSPVMLVNNSRSEHMGILEFAGIFVFLFGITYETIADQQLRRFCSKEENAGKLMVSGLWQFCRHPNYFGESLIWWGIWLFAVPEIDGLFTIVSPILMTFLLRYVSGVPMLEKKQAEKSEWEAYKNKVPAFIPNFFR
ncbi:MAG: DUF1295 domain-containing protein [Bacteroidetes bacterium]|nr:DUF1295 domain-containing protein [Bacteroidota bacterium]